MAQKIITAPMAKIKLPDSSVPIGKVRNVRATENFRRGRVVGIGEITPSELPVLEWTGTLTAGLYMIQLTNAVWKGVDRNYKTVIDFVKNLLFDEGIDIQLISLRKADDGVITETTIGTISKAHLTSEGLDITETQIGGRDATFEYTQPILYGS